jgi:hypothetical protein
MLLKHWIHHAEKSGVAQDIMTENANRLFLTRMSLASECLLLKRRLPGRTSGSSPCITWVIQEVPVKMMLFQACLHLQERARKRT